MDVLSANNLYTMSDVAAFSWSEKWHDEQANDWCAKPKTGYKLNWSTQINGNGKKKMKSNKNQKKKILESPVARILFHLQLNDCVNISTLHWQWMVAAVCCINVQPKRCGWMAVCRKVACVRVYLIAVQISNGFGGMKMRRPEDVVWSWIPSRQKYYPNG